MDVLVEQKCIRISVLRIEKCEKQNKIKTRKKLEFNTGQFITKFFKTTYVNITCIFKLLSL